MSVWKSVAAVPRTTRVGLLEKELQSSDVLSPAEAEQMPVKVWLFGRVAAADEEEDARLDSGADWEWLLLLFACSDPLGVQLFDAHERLFAPCFHFHSCISSRRRLLLSMFSFLCRQKQCH